MLLTTLPWFVIVRWYGRTEERKTEAAFLCFRRLRAAPETRGDHQCLYWTL